MKFVCEGNFLLLNLYFIIPFGWIVLTYPFKHQCNENDLDSR